MESDGRDDLRRCLMVSDTHNFKDEFHFGLTKQAVMCRIASKVLSYQ